jgi:hypothetical protein
MMRKRLRTTAMALGLAATALSAGGSAWAQQPPPPPPDDSSQYNGPPPNGPQGQYDQPQGQYNGPPGQDNGPQGQYNVPPPPGYQPGQDQDDVSPQAREQDERYSYEAERWAEENCIEQRENNTAAGAVIGGVLGAIIGGGIAGPYNRGAGIVAGGALGAVAGGAVGRSANSDNPNCPPGYALRPGAPAFYAGPVYGDEFYAAPGWYDPWIWYGGHWLYRPYPYHRYWYHHMHR